MTFSILEHIEKLEPTKSKGRYICPSCGGNNFTFNEQGQYQCWSGCENKSIRDAIAPLPEKVSPPPKAPRKAQHREWVYTDAEGNKLIKVLRWDYADKPKEVRQKFFINGKWGKSTEEIKKDYQTRVMPLHWEKVKAQALKDGHLFLVEGESTTDALIKAGIPATTYIKNTRNEARVFDEVIAAGVTLVLCPDADTVGIKAMEEVAQQYPTAQWAYAYPEHGVWRNLPSNGGVDFADWIAEGATKEQILATIGPRRHEVKAKATAKGNKQDKIPTPKPSKVAADLRSKYAGQLAFNTQTNEWFYYGHSKPGLWDKLHNAHFSGIVQAELDSWPGMEDGYSAGYVESVIKLLNGRIPVSAWDERTDLIPFENGVYDLKQKKLLPHSPGFGFTWQLPRPYVETENPQFPKINAWLDEATGGKEDLKNTLLCWLAAVLRGRSDLQKLLHVVGPGGTGKGTFARLQTDLIGPRNIVSSRLPVMCSDKFEPYRAYGKRLIVFFDEDRYAGGLATLKSLTGGDVIRGEDKGRSAFEFEFKGMVFIASNYPIFSGDTSSGLHRRIITVPFLQTVASDKVRNLNEEFQSELTSLTTYLLSMDDEHITRTLRGLDGPSHEVEAMSWEMRLRTDSVAAWLNDCVDHSYRIDVNNKLSGTQVGNDINDDTTLFGSYHQYCKRTGSIPKGLREFSPHLEDLCKNIIGWDDTKKHKGRNGAYFTSLHLRDKSDLSPGCIDKLMECDGSRDGCVTDSVTGLEPLKNQGCDGCDGSTHTRSTEKIKDEHSPGTRSSGGTDEKHKNNGNSASHPSHPSQPLYGKGSAPVTAPVTHPSQHPSHPSRPPEVPDCATAWNQPWMYEDGEWHQVDIDESEWNE